MRRLNRPGSALKCQNLPFHVKAGLGGIIVLLLSSHLTFASAQTSPTSTPTSSQSNVISSAAALVNNLLGGSTPATSSPPPSSPTLTASPSPTPVASPTPTPVASPTPRPAGTASSTPAASPSPTQTESAPSPPTPPANPNATSLYATLQMQGEDLWPFSNAMATAVVQSLSQILTTVTISGINIVNVTQGNQEGRRLLATDDVNVNLELVGTSPAAALSMNSDLGNNVLNGQLQRTMARNGLILQNLAITYSNAVESDVAVACSSGSFQNICISDLSSGLSTGAIVGIVVGAGVGALLLIALCATCILRCVRKKQVARVQREAPNKKVMTPQHAQPYWEQNQKEAMRDVVSVSATPSSAVDENGMPIAPSIPGTAVSGDMYAETKEMGGRMARDQLKMKLPEFAARTGRTGSGISRTTSAVSRQASLAPSRTTSHIPDAAAPNAAP